MNKQNNIETFHISTYGCQMNLADSSTLVSTLITRGYRRVKEEDQADLLIFNTCSIREKAEQRVYGRLGEVYKYKQKNPNLKIAVVGCMAQRMGDELIRKVPHVDYVLGTDRLFELPDVIEGLEGTSSVMTAFGHENMDFITPVKETPFSGFITISRGCDNFCSYCIVPFVRGKVQSHSVDYILESVRKLVDEGVVEITLLGQNVNSYKYEDTDFSRLLELVAQNTDIQRIRFMTSHPMDISRRLVDVIGAEEKVMPHIHLPVQSGSNRVLKDMGRFYTIDQYHKMIDYIRLKNDYISLSTDIIVGYPSETGEEFEMTLDVVRKVRYDTAFMFKYSSRPGTRSAEFTDSVPEDEKSDRLIRLIKLQQSIGYEQNQREIGQIKYSLVEGFSKRSKDKLRARTEGNKTVLIPVTEKIEPGQFVPIKINAADAFTLHGEIVEVS